MAKNYTSTSHHRKGRTGDLCQTSLTPRTSSSTGSPKETWSSQASRENLSSNFLGLRSVKSSLCLWNSPRSQTWVAVHGS